MFLIKVIAHLIPEIQWSLSSISLINGDGEWGFGIWVNPVKAKPLEARQPLALTQHSKGPGRGPPMGGKDKLTAATRLVYKTNSKRVTPTWRLLLLTVISRRLHHQSEKVVSNLGWHSAWRVSGGEYRHTDI